MLPFALAPLDHYAMTPPQLFVGPEGACDREFENPSTIQNNVFFKRSLTGLHTTYDDPIFIFPLLREYTAALLNTLLDAEI